MDAQSVALWSDEGVPALFAMLRGCVPPLGRRAGGHLSLLFAEVALGTPRPGSAAMVRTGSATPRHRRIPGGIELALPTIDSGPLTASARLRTTHGVGGGSL